MLDRIRSALGIEAKSATNGSNGHGVAHLAPKCTPDDDDDTAVRGCEAVLAAVRIDVDEAECAYASASHAVSRAFEKLQSATERYDVMPANENRQALEEASAEHGRASRLRGHAEGKRAEALEALRTSERAVTTAKKRAAIARARKAASVPAILRESEDPCARLFSGLQQVIAAADELTKIAHSAIAAAKTSAELGEYITVPPFTSVLIPLMRLCAREGRAYSDLNFSFRNFKPDAGGILAYVIDLACLPASEVSDVALEAIERRANAEFDRQCVERDGARFRGNRDAAQTPEERRAQLQALIDLGVNVDAPPSHLDEWLGHAPERNTSGHPITIVDHRAAERRASGAVDEVESLDDDHAEADE